MTALWPEVTVVVCTYDRPAEIRRTLKSLFDNLKYPFERLRWHIADDGTPGDYVDDIQSWINQANGIEISRNHFGRIDIFQPVLRRTITDRQGWGANVNTALRAVETDYVFFTEDDYVLLRPLDLRPCVALIDVVPTIGLLRFGLAGHAGLGCYLREADISGWLPDYRQGSQGVGAHSPGKLNYLEIERNVSAGPYAFYKYSNRPHLKHRRFHETYGTYPEGVSLAQTEDGMNHLYHQALIGPAIVCPADWVLWHFDHIGVSRQGSPADQESSHAAV